MARYAVINALTGRVENVIAWDGVTPYTHDENCTVVPSENLRAGEYINGFSAPQEEVDSTKAERITRIKTEAQERIYTIVPAWKQTNLIARSIELRDIKDERVWTEIEAAEDAAIRAIWAQVKAIRAASNTAEAAVNAAATIEQINAVNF